MNQLIGAYVSNEQNIRSLYQYMAGFCRVVGGSPSSLLKPASRSTSLINDAVFLYMHSLPLPLLSGLGVSTAYKGSSDIPTGKSGID